MRVFNPKKLRYAKVVDSLGRTIYRLFTRKQAGEPTPLRQLSPGRVLILESHLIGDIIMALPALKALRNRFPLSEIVFVSGPWGRALLEDQKIVDRFVEIRFPWSAYDYSPGNLRKMMTTLRLLRRTRWDLGIDPRGDIRNILFLRLTGAVRRVSYGFTGGEYLLTDVIDDDPRLRHVVEHNANLVEHLGCKVTSTEPSLTISEERLAEARRLLQKSDALGRNLTIGIHPGASKPLRHWRPERFGALADLFLEDPANRVVFFQGPADEDVVAKIRRTMTRSAAVVQRPLRDLPALFKACDLLIGLDSGAVHIAAAAGVPTVVLFGPAEPERVRPVSARSVVIVKEGYWCRPCDQVHCVQPQNNCMDALDVNVVYKHAASVLEGARNAKLRP